jgi:hypothetical protein
MPKTNYMSNRVRLTNGTKSVNPWDVDADPEAWSDYAKNPVNTHLVPAVYNAWQARCKAMADLPFTIYSKGDKVVDSSDNYQNAVGFLANPRMFFWLCEAALVGFGSTYWNKNKNVYSVTKQLQYFASTTITPKIDPKTGLTGFERKAGVIVTQYKTEDILYCWLPDPNVEIGAPTMWPLKSALVCAGAMGSINSFVSDFMARGMVKATMLTVEGAVPPSPDEKERMETFWNKFMRGVQTKIRVFSNAVKPTIIGEGMEAFKGVEITTELIQQINTAMGTRQLLEDENYATANIRQREFYSNIIMPDARLIADALNTQVLNAYGQYLEFEPERLEVFQEDEAQKADSLASLVDVFVQAISPDKALELSLDLLGYELSEEQQQMITDGLATKEKARKEAAEAVKPKEEPNSTPAPDDAPMREDMAKWMRKALKKIGHDVTFASENIPAEVATSIHAGLPNCKTEAEVKGLFYEYENIKSDAPQPNEIHSLIAALRDATKAAYMMPVTS